MFKKAPTQKDWHAYVEDRLSAYIDGQLSDEERANVRKHLQQCERCQASLDSLGWTIKLLKQVPAPPLPRQFTLPLPEAPRAPATPGWLKWGLAAGSAVAVLAFVILFSANLFSNSASSGNRAFAPIPATQVAKLAPTSAAAGGNTFAAQPTAAPAATTAPVMIAPLPAAQPTAAPPTVAETAAPPTEAQPSVGQGFEVATATSAATTAPSEDSSTTEPQRTFRPSIAQNATPTPACASDCGGGTPDNQQTPKVGPANTAGTAPTSPTPPTPVTNGQVNAPVLNVRAAPNSNAEAIGTLYRGTIVQVVGRDLTNSWLEIIFPLDNDQGATGWVAARYIILGSGSPRALPVQQPTATPTPTPVSGAAVATPTTIPESMSVPQTPRGTTAPARVKPTAAPATPTATSPPPTPQLDPQAFSFSATAFSFPTLTSDPPLAGPLSTPPSSATQAPTVPFLQIATIVAFVCAVLFGFAAFLLFRA